MREPRFERDRGDASLDDPGQKAPFYHEGLGGLGSVLGACAFGLAIVILWEIVPVPQPGRSMLAGTVSSAEQASVLSRLSVPPGFAVNLYASGLGDARLMVMTPAGDIIVSSPGAKVLLVKADRNGDGRADGVTTLIDGLGSAHGLALDGDWLYVAETARVFRVRFDAARGQVSGPKESMVALPGGGGHWTRTLKKGPDGWFYVTIGSSCNVCIEANPWRAAMIRFRPGEEPQLHAAGLRNTIGFDWQPGTGNLYGVDNGRDRLGDHFPPDELNRIVEGGFYGWPYLNGDNVPDPNYGEREDPRIANAIAPAHGFSAHVAPLSILFLRHLRAPGYEHAALVAQHGSWNRSRKIGYRVVSLHWGPDGSISEKPFLVGFEKDEDVVGRPVDVIEAPDGTIYVSDDYGGAIWRIVRR